MADFVHPVLRLTAARHVLKLTTASGLVAVANTILCDGVYTPALGELAYLRQPTQWECDSLLLAAVRETATELPDLASAVRTVMDHCAIGLVEEIDRPDDMLAEVYDLYIALDDARFTSGIADLLQPFVELCYAAAEARGYASYATERGLDAEPDLTEIHAQCVRLASVWCHDRWAASVAGVRASPTVIAIAERVAADHAYDLLPVLADALEDAGCTDQDVLWHCRNSQQHVRACWVVDLLLGTEELRER